VLAANHGQENIVQCLKRHLIQIGKRIIANVNGTVSVAAIWCDSPASRPMTTLQ